MRTYTRVLAFIMLIITMVAATGCKSEENNDSDVRVTTYTPQDITQTTAVCGGDVIVAQGLSLNEFGVCWSTESNPTADDSHLSTTNWSEPYVCTITGLEPGTKYHVRAYALRGLEYYYGDDKSFITDDNNGGGNNSSDVRVTTYTPQDITATTAKCGGDVIVTQGLSINKLGVCWSKERNPTIEDDTVSTTNWREPFVCTISNLEANVEYHVRAYAIRGLECYYGEDKSFTTEDATLPTVTTAEPTVITHNTVSCGGEVTDDGGAAVTERGVCWSTSQNPTISDSHTSDGTGTGNFTSSLTSLTANTTYYVRAYATNSVGTAYGNEVSFTTNSPPITFTVNGVTFTMKPVEGGTFRMGCNDSNALANEQPVHSVTLSSFYMGETEVTQALWEAVMGGNPSCFHGEQLPVESVSWNDIVNDFLPRLNQLTGRIFRLPTEAEWEYAARGGNKSNGTQYAGGGDIGSVAWYTWNSGSTHAVKGKQPNELGLYDMSGNVWEWCEDWYGSYSSGSQTNPQGPSSGDYRMVRGGSWNDSARSCRVSHRVNGNPAERFNIIGLRLCLPQ